MFSLNETGYQHQAPQDSVSMDGLMQDENTYLLNFSSHSPLDWSLPLYGYVMPALVTITTFTNTFIIIVLSQKHLRTPTNAVLLSMAVTDLLTGCCSVPWVVYYYTLKGYQVDAARGLSAFWCHAYGYFFELLPSAFHTAAIWLAVFLAVQRYIYVCSPDHVYQVCTPTTTKLTIFGIIGASFVTVLPELATQKRFAHHNHFTHRDECYSAISPWVRILGEDIVYSVRIWMRAILHGLPCILLLIFTCKLGKTLKKAEIRKKSWAAVENSRKQSRGSDNVPGRRTFYATNRMLAVICSSFLLIEIPAAVLHGVQFALAMGFVPLEPEIISVLNKSLIIRNILIVMISPIQFTIYCSMSEQFRLTVRQLFTSKRLFVAQAQGTYHGGKRYSLVLVDVDSEDKSGNHGATKCFTFLTRTNENGEIEMNHQSSSNRCEQTTIKYYRGGSPRIEEDDAPSSLRDSAVTCRLTLSEEASSV